MEFNREVGGKVEEHWVEINLLDLVQQLGVATVLGPGLVARMLVRQARNLRSRLSTGHLRSKPFASGILHGSTLERKFISGSVCTLR
jgi:hypothetical protein